MLERTEEVSCRLMRAVLPLMFALFVVLIWAAITRLFKVPTYLLPDPFRVFQRMIQNGGYFVGHSLTTLIEAVLGFILAVMAGFLLGTTFAVFGVLERMVLPYAIGSQAVPIVAVAPLLILWLGNNLASKVAMAALLCFFPMVVNTTRGLRSASDEQVALMRVYNATRWQIFWKLRFPSSLTFIVSGMRISAALAMIGAIVAEYAGADRGIGYVIMQATYRTDTVQMLGGIFYSALGGLLIFTVVLVIEHRFLPRYTSNS